MKTRLITVLLLAGCFLMWVGTSSNRFVERANGGQMPVWCINDAVVLSIAGVRTHTCQLTTRTHYVLLADVVPVVTVARGRIGITSEESIGDILVCGGFVVAASSLFLVLLFTVRLIAIHCRGAH